MHFVLNYVYPSQMWLCKIIMVLMPTPAPAPAPAPVPPGVYAMYKVSFSPGILSPPWGALTAAIIQLLNTL